MVDLVAGQFPGKIDVTMADFGVGGGNTTSLNPSPNQKILKQDTLISTNDVINTNNCYLSICKTKYKNRVIILSAIDNLIKGGAGQAIQNMNLKFNFPETKGL